MNQTRKVASWRGVKVACGEGKPGSDFFYRKWIGADGHIWQQVFFSAFISLCDLERFAGFVLLLGDIFTME